MTLNEFVIEIAQDPNKRMQFEADPRDYIMAGDIRPAYKYLLRYGTDQEILQEIEREVTEGEYTGDDTVTDVSTEDDKGGGNVQRSFEVDPGNVQSGQSI